MQEPPSLSPHSSIYPPLTKRAYFIILGLGYMGWRSLLALNFIRERFRSKGVGIEIIALAEPDLRVYVPVKKVCEGMLIKPTFCSDFDEVSKTILQEIQLASEDIIIVYDASPTYLHYKHLYFIQNLPQNMKRKVYYFGEKPLITHEDQLKSLREFPAFYCDFIETESLVFKTLRQYIQDNGFRIEKLNFWRCGSTGIKKVFNPEERIGVTGGALEDKAPHDLSITIGLLGDMDAFTQEPDDLYTLTFASIPYFMPADRVRLGFGGALGHPLFMTVKGKSTTKISENVPKGPSQMKTGDATADAVFKVKITWHKQHGRLDIQSDYEFSWIGVKGVVEALEKKLGPDGLGFSEKEWLGRGSDKTEDGLEYLIEEARVAIIEDKTQGGKSVSLVCNFLSKLGIEPFVWEVTNGYKKDDQGKIPLVNNVEFSGNSLARVFATVVNASFYGSKSATLLGKQMSYLVHHIMMESREKAFQNYKLIGSTPQKEFSKVTPFIMHRFL